jgi:hypothetical protein
MGGNNLKTIDAVNAGDTVRIISGNTIHTGQTGTVRSTDKAGQPPSLVVAVPSTKAKGAIVGCKFHFHEVEFVIKGGGLDNAIKMVKSALTEWRRIVGFHTLHQAEAELQAAIEAKKVAEAQIKAYNEVIEGIREIPALEGDLVYLRGGGE